MTEPSGNPVPGFRRKRRPARMPARAGTGRSLPLAPPAGPPSDPAGDTTADTTAHAALDSQVEDQRGPARGLPGSFLGRVLFVSAIPPVLVGAVGIQYYLLPHEERPWSPLHDWYGPSGFIGQSLGFLALGLFLFLWLFPIRKRASWLRFTGSVPRWLDVHIVAGLLVPFIGALHAAWRFNGLIGLGYFAMLVVSISGVIGRYLYAHIPRKRSGLELSREDAATERRALIGRLVQSTGIPMDHVVELLAVSPPTTSRLGIVSTVRALLRDDLERRRATRKLVAEWKAALPKGERPDRRTLHEIRRAARREMALQQQIRLLDATHRVFRLWHVAHLPFAITAFLAVLLHVALVIAFGATWLTQ